MLNYYLSHHFYVKPMKAKIKQLTTKDLLSEQPFYKQSIRKLRSKKLINQQLLQVLSFYDDVVILRKQKAFKNYGATYEVETIDNKSLDDSLFLSKTSIKNLFNELLRENRRFKYILSTKTTLKKHVNDNETCYSIVYFNSKAKMIINQRYYFNESFLKILNSLDIWINEISGWTIDQIEGLYVNVTNYQPLSGSSYIPLPKVLNNSMKVLINIKNKDHKCFMRCHVRLINLADRTAERIIKED